MFKLTRTRTAPVAFVANDHAAAPVAPVSDRCNVTVCACGVRVTRDDWTGVWTHAPLTPAAIARFN